MNFIKATVFAIFSHFQVIGYFAFLVAHACFNQVTLHYLIAGHTHFTPDRVFGWLSGQLKNKDIFDFSDVLAPLNHTLLAPRYSGEELQASDIERWGDLVSSTLPHYKGIKRWHWVRLSLADEDGPVVRLVAKQYSDDIDFTYSASFKVSAFPDMAVDSYSPRALKRKQLDALRAAAPHMGTRTFRYPTD